MKGRTTNTQRTNACGYASGGAVPAGTSSAKASGEVKARRDGGACRVDGAAAKPNLGRPMRRRADGGRTDDKSPPVPMDFRTEADKAKAAQESEDRMARDQHSRGISEGLRTLRGVFSPWGMGRHYGEPRAKGGAVKGNWIAGAVGKNPGALHKALKVPMGDKIPAAKIDKATHSSNPRLAKQANLAKTLKGFNKG